MALQSAISAGGLTALALNAVLPRDSTDGRADAVA
jgi:hypothetical protein